MLPLTIPETLLSGVTISPQQQLLYCLCNSWATKRKLDGEGDHETVAQRALIGTWIIDEVSLAMQNGYEFIEIFEVYEYAVTQYDPQTVQGGPFVECVDTILNWRRRLADIRTGFEPRRTRIVISLISMLAKVN